MSYFDAITVPVDSYPGVLYALDFVLSTDGFGAALTAVLLIVLALILWGVNRHLGQGTVLQPFGTICCLIAAILVLVLATATRMPPGEVAIRGNSYTQLLAMTAGCDELGSKPLVNKTYRCYQGLAKGKEFTQAMQLKAKPVLEPVVNRMADSGCVWAVGSLHNTVHCNAASDAARELDGKTLFQAVQPTLPAPFQTCSPVMSTAKAEVQPVFLKDVGKLYRFVHQRAIAYDCPDLGGTLSPAELSRKLMEQAFPA